MNDLAGVYRELGELVASVRDLKHTTNNTAQKMDKVAGLVATVDRLVEDYKALREEVDVLKAAEDRRRGAVGLVDWMSRHWPFAAISAGITIAWAWVSGR